MKQSAMKAKAATSSTKTSTTSKASRSHTYVYNFGRQTDGNASMRELLGGKGANLAEMAAIGLPVPPGFTISTEVCTYFYAHDRSYPRALAGDVKTAIGLVEAQMKKTFGGKDNPLLVSVRSGDEEDLRRQGQSAARLGALRRAGLHARHDGHHSQPGPERCHR